MMRSSLNFILCLAATAAASTNQANIYDESAATLNVQLSQASYCADPQALMPSDSLIVTSILEDDAGLLNGGRAIVGCDTANRSLFVAYRGSSNLENWLDNMKFRKINPYASNESVYVERGFWLWYQSLKANVDAALLSAITDARCTDAGAQPFPSPAPVSVTGHSAGAAVATLQAYDLVNGDAAGTKGALALTTVYTFGSPRVGNLEFYDSHSTLMKAGSHAHFRVTHYHDMVPHVPPLALRFHHVAQEIFYNEENSAFKLCDGSGEDDSCSNSCGPVSCTSIDDHLNYIGIPLGSDQCPEAVIKVKAEAEKK